MWPTRHPPANLTPQTSTRPPQPGLQQTHQGQQFLQWAQAEATPSPQLCSCPPLMHLHSPNSCPCLTMHVAAASSLCPTFCQPTQTQATTCPPPAAIALPHPLPPPRSSPAPGKPVLQLTRLQSHLQPTSLPTKPLWLLSWTAPKQTLCSPRCGTPAIEAMQGVGAAPAATAVAAVPAATAAAATAMTVTAAVEADQGLGPGLRPLLAPLVAPLPAAPAPAVKAPGKAGVGGPSGAVQRAG